MSCRQPFHHLKTQLKAEARCRFGHSLRIEFAVCSQDNVPWFALTCGQEGTGSALVLRPKRSRGERTSSFHVVIGMSDAMPPEKLCRVALRTHCCLRVSSPTTRHSLGMLTDSSGTARRGLPDGNVPFSFHSKSPFS